MLHQDRIRWIAPLIMLAILAIGAGAVRQADGQATAAPTASVPTDAIEVTFGPGPFKLQPLTGLADLSGYQASLRVDFKGKEGGKASTWTETLALVVRGKPSARVLTATFKGNAPSAAYIEPWSAAMNGVFYTRDTDGACSASVGEADSNAPLVWEPADLLPAVRGAEEAGAKKVNGIAAKGYKFDERALGATDRAKATGEVWVADPGGYVLKYSLTVKGGPEYFGEDKEGTLTWAYDVTKAGQVVAIVLPKDCPEGLVDAPVMDDAENVGRFPGTTMYTTKSTIAQVADFYQKKLPEAGWKLEGKPGVTERAALLDFKQGKSQLTVFVTVGDGGTEVRLILSTVQ
jgi:hypothetical protein